MCHLHINTLARWVEHARIRIKLKDFVTKLLQRCYLRWGPLPDLVTPQRDFPLLAEQPFLTVGPPTLPAGRGATHRGADGGAGRDGLLLRGVLAPLPFGVAAPGEVGAEVGSPEEALSYWFPEGIDDADPQTRRRQGRRWIPFGRRASE